MHKNRGENRVEQELRTRSDQQERFGPYFVLGHFRSRFWVNGFLKRGRDVSSRLCARSRRPTQLLKVARELSKGFSF